MERVLSREPDRDSDNGALTDVVVLRLGSVDLECDSDVEMRSVSVGATVLVGNDCVDVGRDTVFESVFDDAPLSDNDKVRAVHVCASVDDKESVAELGAVRDRRDSVREDDRVAFDDGDIDTDTIEDGVACDDDRDDSFDGLFVDVELNDGLLLESEGSALSVPPEIESSLDVLLVDD